MKSNARSSITLPADEVARIERLRRRVGERTYVGVVRKALRLLEDTTDRAALQKAYAEASRRTRRSLSAEIESLDHLASEGLED